MTHYKREVVLLLIPFLYGLIVNSLMIFIHPLLSQLIFGVFWFWVGMIFAQLNINKIKSFLLGNTVWAFSFGLFIWQFIINDDAGRNLLIAGLSQHYISSFIWLGSKVYMLFDNVIHGTNIMLIAYISMFLIFFAGFVYATIRERL